MAYADKCYVGKRVKLELLSPEDVRQIHEATLDVIENVGVKFHSQNALDILEANGASVDRETTVAKIPAAAVEKAMSTVPHEFVLGARNPEYDLPLDGEHVYISSDGCGVFSRDPVTGEVRSSRKEDLENCAKVVQALDNVSATSAVVSAQDFPIETRVLHEFDACVRSSEKHTIVVSIKE
ncbi:MAG TPA: trimethylamine methyltransferase family protein, partial [Solirubrobacterales bacterium]|nr:trimethylamine methyltransferase family protein [Solirubrobacterales bacterium]